MGRAVTDRTKARLKRDATKVPEGKLLQRETIEITQAERIIKKFGGEKRLAEALSAIGKPKSLSQIYRWKYTRENQGCNGVIPTASLLDIIEAARIEGVLLTQKDLDIRPSKIVVTHYAEERLNKKKDYE